MKTFPTLDIDVGSSILMSGKPKSETMMKASSKEKSSTSTSDVDREASIGNTEAKRREQELKKQWGKRN